MSDIIPAILAQDAETFRERLLFIEGTAPVVQVDVMDGAFVPNRTWFDAEAISQLSTMTAFELHLMVKNPQSYIEEVRAIGNVKRVIWHIEAQVDHAALIQRCHDLGKEAGLAVSPHTPTEKLAPYLDTVDEILVMGAEPGFSGQALLPQTVDRVRELHAAHPALPIGFDINVNEQTIPLLREAGVTRFCAASAIFGAPDPLEALRRLQEV